MNTFEKLADLLHRDFAIPREKLVPEATLEALDIDSLRMIEILFNVEEAFKVTVPADANELRARIRSLGDLAAYLDELVGAGSGKTP